MSAGDEKAAARKAAFARRKAAHGAGLVHPERLDPRVHS